MRLGMSSRVGLYLGFAMTGVSVSMPGVLLPLLLRRWELGDARGGLLLFCFFLASTTGALLSLGTMNRSAARGAALTAAGAVWLALASRGWGFAAMAVYGLGLGIAMTSVSLLVSRRWPAERRVEMMRLNLLWAAGACTGPWLGLGGHALRAQISTERPLHVLSGIAGFFAVWAVWMWLAESAGAASSEGAELQVSPLRCASVEMTGLNRVQSPVEMTELGAEPEGPARTRRWALLAIPVTLLVMVFCATGVEAATGGWLAAYAQRLGETAGTTIGATTAFWAGLLSARVAHSVHWTERIRERTVLLASTALMAAGLAVLVAWPGSTSAVAAAFAVGFGAGPVYPLLLAMVLRMRETRGIFVLAGVGSAVLPLATGGISASVHSLAAGLGVPLAAAAMMFVLSWWGVVAHSSRDETAR